MGPERSLWEKIPTTFYTIRKKTSKNPSSPSFSNFRKKVPASFISNRLLDGRGAGIYKKVGRVNKRPLYEQIDGGGPNSENYIYFDFTKAAYVVGELRENKHFIYEVEGFRSVFIVIVNQHDFYNSQLDNISLT